MQKTAKKFLSMLLALMMVLSILPTAVFATEQATVAAPLDSIVPYGANDQTTGTATISVQNPVTFTGYSAFENVPYYLVTVPAGTTYVKATYKDAAILTNATSGVASGYYADVPDALIRQAMIDGNGVWQIYRKIVLPNTKIATITVFVFQCTSIWNEMLFALVLGGYDSKPATIALNELAGTMAAEFNVQMAGSLILALPVLVLYIFMGKYLISGQMSGAVTAS